MARSQLLIEGFAPDELLALAQSTSLLPLFSGKPVAVTYGRATLLGGIRKSRGRLIVEVAAMQGAAAKALAALMALTRRIAALRGVRTLEWRLPNRRPRVERLATGSRARA
jgi:hypothetical protein